MATVAAGNYFSAIVGPYGRIVAPDIGARGLGEAQDAAG
jgi:hypothetical protein